jgi:ubiquinone/menaquinone biosynthesis C-methylase UbiE
MAYEQFAYLYDYLMKDAPYEAWRDFVKEKMKQYGRASSTRLLDVGCGTGELSIRLAQDGFQVTGIDLSEDMLAVAQAKAEESGVRVEFFQQNMTELEGFAPFDCVVIFCDSLNYLQNEAEVRQTFARIYEHLHDGGLFMFDVHSTYKMEHVFANQTFANNEEKISYIWNCFPGDVPYSVEHELTFFVQQSNGMYERFDEWHMQRTYEVERYKQWLLSTGFEVLDISADFTGEFPTETSERIFFVAKK